MRSWDDLYEFPQAIHDSGSVELAVHVALFTAFGTFVFPMMTCGKVKAVNVFPTFPLWIQVMQQGTADHVCIRY